MNESKAQMAMFSIAAGMAAAHQEAVKPGSSKREQFKPIMGTVGTMMDLPVADIKIDRSYQRPLNVKLARKIATDWSWLEYQPISLSMRPDGSVWCYDGQHRLSAAIMRGDIPTLCCWVVELEGAKEEAGHWINLNINRRRIAPMEEFAARTTAKTPEHYWLMNFLEGRGLTLIAEKGKGHANLESNQTTATKACITALKKKDGELAVTWAYDVARNSWHGNHYAYSGRIIEALLRVYTRITPANRLHMLDLSGERLGRYSLDELWTEFSRIIAASGTTAMSVIPSMLIDKFNYKARAFRI